MTAWSDGYNSDIGYTHGFYRELSPAYLGFVCLLNGIRPPRIDRPFRYCELGCGQGMTLNILAAAYPQGRFVGIDFNPLHVAGARRLAEEAGLDNVSFLERSFQDIAAGAGAGSGDGDGEGFDFITLHGVYSWISPENRQAVVDILARWLNPGGLVYVSYNAQPGWSPMMPLQSLLLAHAAANPGRSDRQFEAALGFVNRLKDAGAGYFAANPGAAQHLATMAGQDRRYLTHEYLNTYWEPLAHARVATDLERAKLTYGCSATIAQNMDELAVKAELRPLLDEIADPAFVQTVRDFAMNQVFRRDIFLRGADRMGRREAGEELQRQRLTLQVPRESGSLSVQVPLGELKHAPDLGLPILDALAAGMPSLGEIAAMPAMARHDFATISRFVALLVASGQAHPAAPAYDTPSGGDMYGGDMAGQARAAGGRLNRAIARRMLADEAMHHFAAPALGMGIQVDTLERIVLSGLLTGQPADARSLAGFTAEILRGAGRSVLAEDGTPIATPDGAGERLALVIAGMLSQKLPVWRRAGII